MERDSKLVELVFQDLKAEIEQDSDPIWYILGYLGRSAGLSSAQIDELVQILQRKRREI